MIEAIAGLPSVFHTRDTFMHVTQRKCQFQAPIYYLLYRTLTLWPPYVHTYAQLIDDA